MLLAYAGAPFKDEVRARALRSRPTARAPASHRIGAGWRARLAVAGAHARPSVQ